MNLPTKILAAAAVAGSVSSLPGSAGAVPLAASLSLRGASAPMVETVQWRRRGWGGVGLGIAAGALIGGAIAASSPYYGYGYGYGYGYPAYYGYSYGYPAYSYGYGYPYRSYGYVSYGWPGYYGYYRYPRYYRRYW
jgi:hypothetical protein